MIIDQADVIFMQNWNHLKDVVNLINRIPEKVIHKLRQTGEIDFSRVKQNFLDNLGKFWRQTITIGEHRSVEINQLFKKYCFNPRVNNFFLIKGIIKINQTSVGSINKILVN